ncbi:MAG: hypothetical protein AAF736_13670 [Pseudomonadota bacterium]
MNRLVFLLLTTIIGTASAADKADPLSCLDPVVAATFLTSFGSQGTPSVSPEPPQPLSGVEQLEGISFLGNYRSNTTFAQNQNLGFVSDKPVREVEQQLEQFLMSKGWEETRTNRSQATGFRQVNRSQGVTLCSNENGMMSVMVRAFEGQTIANMMSFQAGKVDCSRMFSGIGYQTGGLNEHLPSLDLPDGAKMTPTFNIASSSSGQTASTKASFEAEMTNASVIAHFDQQIEAQGWSLDAGWEGQQVAGSSWTKNVDDMSVVGVLTLVANDNSFAVRFEIQALP